MLLLFFPLVVVLNICFSISHYYVTERVCRIFMRLKYKLTVPFLINIDSKSFSFLL